MVVVNPVVLWVVIGSYKEKIGGPLGGFCQLDTCSCNILHGFILNINRTVLRACLPLLPLRNQRQAKRLFTVEQLLFDCQ